MIERLEKDLKEKETLEDFDPTDREPNAQGGLTRTKFAIGSDDELPEDPTKPINPFGPKPTGPVLPDKSMMASSSSYQNYVKAALSLGLKPIRIDEFESLTPIMDVSEILNLTEQLNRSKNATGGLAGIINL